MFTWTTSCSLLFFIDHDVEFITWLWWLKNNHRVKELFIFNWFQKMSDNCSLIKVNSIVKEWPVLRFFLVDCVKNDFAHFSLNRYKWIHVITFMSKITKIINWYFVFIKKCLNYPFLFIIKSILLFWYFYLNIFNILCDWTVKIWPNSIHKFIWILATCGWYYLSILVLLDRVID